MSDRAARQGYNLHQSSESTIGISLDETTLEEDVAALGETSGRRRADRPRAG